MLGALPPKLGVDVSGVAPNTCGSTVACGFVVAAGDSFDTIGLSGEESGEGSSEIAGDMSFTRY